jgi:hypothetical protein
MSIVNRIQSARLRHAARYPGQGVWRVYIDAVELLNPDGTTPVIKALSVNERMAIVALNGVSEDVAIWRVRHLGPAQTLNATWTLSLDGGVTTFSVQAITRLAKTAATANTVAVFEYILQGNPPL